MVIEIIYLIISFVFAYIYENKRTYMLKKISVADNADDACSLRRSFINWKIFIVIIYAIITMTIFIFPLCLNIELKPVAIFIVTSLFNAYVQKRSLPISGKRPHDIKESCFVLYLRGFAYDNYSLSEFELKNGVENAHAFSEAHFISFLKKYLPVYAVGMTKEMESPVGAERIYLNDNNWEEEVYNLMERATMIVILLNDSSSCISEIAMSNNFLRKVVFISNRYTTLFNIRKALNKESIYPLPVGLKENTISYCLENMENEYIEYENNEKSYIKVVKTIMEEKFGLKRFLLTKKTENKVTTIYSIIAVILICFFALFFKNTLLVASIITLIFPYILGFLFDKYCILQNCRKLK